MSRFTIIIKTIIVRSYKSCTAKNIRSAYQSYKILDKVPEERLYEVETFIHEEYTRDNNKAHLLFLLCMIYLYQENLSLAKSYFYLFSKQCNDLLSAKSLGSIFNTLEQSFKDVPLLNEFIN